MPGSLAPTSGVPEPAPDWWPKGVDEALVRECNCESCEELVDALDNYQQGISADGAHAALTAFADGGSQE